MVDLFDFQGYADWEQGVAHHKGVVKHVHKESAKMAQKARTLLAAHRSEGHAEIEHFTTPVDGWVVLSDERGLKAAMSIEFGRGPADPGDPDYDKDPFPNGTEGIYVLHRATGAAGGGKSRAHFPHSKRRKDKR